MENTFKNYEKKLRQKHLNELQYLQNKFQAEFDELNKEKQKDMEFLDKKYSVKSKDLVIQQKRENTVHKFKNYGNRISKLSNNYDKNKYIEDEIEKKSENTPIRESDNYKKNEIESDNTKNNLYNEEEKNNLKDVEFPEYEN